VRCEWVVDEGRQIHPVEPAAENASSWTPQTPEYRGRPPRSYLNHAEHSNPNEVRVAQR